jgi:hypothetical protein
MWAKIDSKNWKRDEDELTSAQLLLNEGGSAGGLGVYRVEAVPIDPEPGLTVIAFSLPEILNQWGGRIRELSMDSTCEIHGTIFSCAQHTDAVTPNREYEWISLRAICYTW